MAQLIVEVRISRETLVFGRNLQTLNETAASLGGDTLAIQGDIRSSL
jgi:hypothetical protein